MNSDGTIPDGEEYDDATYDGFQHPDDRPLSDAQIEKMEEEDRLYMERRYNRMRLQALVGFDDPWEERQFMEAELSVALEAAKTTGDWSEWDELNAAYDRRSPELWALEHARHADAVEAWSTAAPADVGALMAALGKR